MPRRALFLANRNARSCAELADHAQVILKANDFELIIPNTQSRDDVSRAIESHAADVDCVIVAGGDGSINAALAGLLKTGLPLGVIPAGTANDLARTLELPTDMIEAIEVIVRGHTRKIDVGIVNDHPFLNAASMGLSVRITRGLTKPLKRRWGPFAYVLTAIRAVVQSRAFHVEIESAGEIARLKTVQLVIGNGRYFGSGMTVHEDAQIDDQKLDVYSVGVYHWWSLIALLPSLRRGTHHSQKNVYNASGHQFVIRSHRPRSITADGEMLTQTPANFSLCPAAISVYASNAIST